MRLPQCLNTPPAAALDTCEGFQGVHICFCVACASMYSTDIRAPACHINEFLDTSTEGAFGSGDCGEGRAMLFTAV